jgi:hypothetical protein
MKILYETGGYRVYCIGVLKMRLSYKKKYPDKKNELLNPAGNEPTGE